MEYSPKIQVLVAAMHQKDHSLVKKMNIQSDAIIGNQCDQFSMDFIGYNGHEIRYINTNERGVGLNRNNTLMRATGDILLFADDDMVYVDGYPKMVRDAFNNNKDADAIIFNIITTGTEKDYRRFNAKGKKVHMYNALNYGTVRIAVRRESLLKARITFSTCFGGGTRYSSGEDTLFICDMLRKGLKIYTSPFVIGEVDQSTSTWFNGYNEKYLHDKGALYSAAFPRLSSLMCLQDLIRHPYIYKDAGKTIIQAWNIMKQGINDYCVWGNKN